MGKSNGIQNVLLFCMGFILVFQLYNNENQTNDLASVEGRNGTAKKLEQYNNESKKAVKEKADKNSMKSILRFKNLRLKYHMEFAHPCPEHTKLIMLSMTRRDGFVKRESVRRTWMNDSSPGELIRFLIADVGVKRDEANDTQKRLEEEQKEHGDLLFMHGFDDQYNHLHLKWYAGLQWQQSFCADAEWVMKVDDDAVLHLPRLAHWIDAKFSQIVTQQTLVYLGFVISQPNPIRNKKSKWYISEDVYQWDWYPSFMQGAVYLTTSATIRAILSHAREVVGFYLDDVVFTGILAELANVTLSDHKMHFKGDLNLDERNIVCANGTPSALSMSGFHTLRDYEYHYGRLKAIKCKTN